MKTIVSILVSVFVAIFMGGFLSEQMEWSHLGTSAGLMVLSFVPQVPAGAMGMALDVEVWKDFIMPNLFANNEFLLKSVDASEHVLQGKVVHIPQAGSPSGVKKNRDVLPAKVTIRGDRDVTYALDEYTTDPRLFPNADKILSYDKFASVAGEDMDYLRQVIAAHMLYKWRHTETADFVVRTTGGSVATHLVDSTGSRKSFVIKNLQTAGKLMNKQNIPMVGRSALFSADMLDQLKDSLTATQYKDFSAAYDEKNGVVGKLEGFDIYMRSSVLRADNSAVPATLPLDDIGYPIGVGNADNDVVLCWQDKQVERAIGDIIPFTEENSPVYYGDLFSLLTNMGGRKRRDTGLGVIAIIQDAA